MILDKEKNKIKPYYSNYKPCNIYRGKEKIAGYKTSVVNDNSATFENTYNDFVEISMNGKAEQKQYEGYNLLENILQTQTLNGVTFTVNEDKSVHIKGTASLRTEVDLWTKSTEKTFILKKGVIYYNNSNTTLYFHGSNGYFLIGNKQTYMPEIDINLNKIYIRVEASETVDKIIYPMISTKENLLDLSKTQTFTQYGKTINIEDYKIKLTCEKSTSTGVMCIKITNGYDLSFNDGGAKWKNETFITAGDYTLSAKKITNIGSMYIRYKDNTFDLLLYGDNLNQTKKLQNKDIAYIIMQIGIENGQSGNNEFSNIQLIDNTIEKTYEPYCGGVPSPNLDYPQEIKTVDKIGINISSVNLFDGVPIADVKPSRFQHCDYETIYDEELKRNVLHITCGKENQIWPVINYNLPKRLEKDKYYCFKFKYKYFLENPVNNIGWDTLWFFMNESSNGWDNFQLAHSKKAITTVAEKWTDRIIKFKADNPYFDKNEYSYSKILLSLGNGRYIQGGESVNVTWLKKEVFISDVMLYEITEEEYNDTNYTSLDYKQYFSPITKENILPTNEELVSLPNGTKDEIRENKIIKRVKKILIDENSTPKNFVDLVGDYVKVSYNFSTDSKVKNVTSNTHKNYLCNRLNSKDIDWSWVINKKNWYLEVNHLVFSIPKNIVESQAGTTNKEKIQNYLKANPIVFYAELETPQEIAIGKIKSLPLTTKVDIKSNLDTEIIIKCKEME